MQRHNVSCQGFLTTHVEVNLICTIQVVQISTYAHRVRPVTVQFLKNPDVTHWGFEAHWLGEDEWGNWMALPTGSTRWKGEEPHPPTSSPAVFCAPTDGWWHLHYNGRFAGVYSHFIDIATPPVWITPNRYEMIDLDLDVAIPLDGTIKIQDEDEFESIR